MSERRAKKGRGLEIRKGSRRNNTEQGVVEKTSLDYKKRTYQELKIGY